MRKNSKSLFVENLNRNKLLLRSWVSNEIFSFHALSIVILKVLALKLLSIHIFPTRVLWNDSSSHISSSTATTISSSSLERGMYFHFSMAEGPSLGKKKNYLSIYQPVQEEKEKLKKQRTQ